MKHYKTLNRLKTQCVLGSREPLVGRLIPRGNSYHFAHGVLATIPFPINCENRFVMKHYETFIRLEMQCAFERAKWIASGSPLNVCQVAKQQVGRICLAAIILKMKNFGALSVSGNAASVGAAHLSSILNFPSVAGSGQEQRTTPETKTEGITCN